MKTIRNVSNDYVRNIYNREIAKIKSLDYEILYTDYSIESYMCHYYVSYRIKGVLCTISLGIFESGRHILTIEYPNIRVDIVSNCK